MSGFEPFECPQADLEERLLGVADAVALPSLKILCSCATDCRRSCPYLRQESPGLRVGGEADGSASPRTTSSVETPECNALSGNSHSEVTTTLRGLTVA